MVPDMKWSVPPKIKATGKNLRQDEIIGRLLKNRGIKKSQIKDFLHPVHPSSYTPESIGIDPIELKKTLDIIQKAVTAKTPILIYGDYDADGITATAILWQVIFKTLTPLVWPFIPIRAKHGYGLSVNGLKAALLEISAKFGPAKPLIITVDNGITAHHAAQYLQDQGIDLIITDHHQKSPTIPVTTALIHSHEVSGAGVSWFLAKAIDQNEALKSLDLVAIGTIADMMPLVGVNRSLAKWGLNALSDTNRPGLKALFTEAGLDPLKGISTYDVNFLIAPRLNAAGRLEHALDSLRLLLTNNPKKAKDLAIGLGLINHERQDLTTLALYKATSMISDPHAHLIVLAGEDFHEGIIGLVAGKITEKLYRPSIIISQKSDVSKGSARSIKGVNIIDLIRNFDDLLINSGGHPAAAGFTIPTKNIDAFIEQITAYSAIELSNTLFEPVLDIDCRLMTEDISFELLNLIETLKPFGIGNPTPVFSLENVQPIKISFMGKDKQHIKLTLNTLTASDVVGFGFAGQCDRLTAKDSLNLAFTLNENRWNGKSTLQLILKDLVINQ